MAKDEYDWNAWRNEPEAPVGSEDPALAGLDFTQAPISKKKGKLTGILSPLVAGFGAGASEELPALGKGAARAVGVLPTPNRQGLIAEQQALPEEPEFGGWLSKQMYRAGRMMPASLAPTLTGAGIGALIGNVPGALIGATVGGIGGAGLFGASQYQQTKEKALAKGVDPGNAPIINAMIESIGEGISNVLPIPIAKQALGQAIKAGIKPFLRSAGANVAKIGAAEVIPEMLQAGGESAVEKAYGIDPNVNPWSEAAGTIAPTMIMSGLTGGLLSGAQKFVGQRKRTDDIDLTKEPGSVIPHVGTNALQSGSAIPQFNQNVTQRLTSDLGPMFLSGDQQVRQNIIRSLTDPKSGMFPELSDMERNVTANALINLGMQPNTFSGTNRSGGTVETLIPTNEEQRQEAQRGVGIFPLLNYPEIPQEYDPLAEVTNMIGKGKQRKVRTEAQQAAAINKRTPVAQPDIEQAIATGIAAIEPQIAQQQVVPTPEQIAQEEAARSAEQDAILQRAMEEDRLAREQGNQERVAEESKPNKRLKPVSHKNAAPGTVEIEYNTPRWGLKKTYQTTDPTTLVERYGPEQRKAWLRPTGDHDVVVSPTKPSGYWLEGQINNGVFTNERTRIKMSQVEPAPVDNLEDLQPKPKPLPTGKNVTPARRLQSTTEKKYTADEINAMFAGASQEPGQAAPIVQPTETFAGRNTEIVKQAVQSQKDSNLINIVKDIVPRLGDQGSISRTVAPDDPLIKSVLNVYKGHGYQWKSTPREVNLSFDKNSIRIQDISTMPGEAPSFQVTFTTDLSNKPGAVYKTGERVKEPVKKEPEARPGLTEAQRTKYQQNRAKFAQDELDRRAKIIERITKYKNENNFRRAVDLRNELIQAEKDYGTTSELQIDANIVTPQPVAATPVSGGKTTMQEAMRKAQGESKPRNYAFDLRKELNRTNMEDYLIKNTGVDKKDARTIVDMDMESKRSNTLQYKTVDRKGNEIYKPVLNMDDYSRYVNQVESPKEKPVVKHTLQSKSAQREVTASKLKKKVEIPEVKKETIVKVEKKPAKQEKSALKLDDIKFKGDTITTPELSVQFPKNPDGNISFKNKAGDEVKSLSMLTDQNDMARSIASEIVKRHSGIDVGILTKRVLKEMTGETKAEPVAASKDLLITTYNQLRDRGMTADKIRGLTEEQAQNILSTKVPMTNHPNVVKIYGRQLTLKELVSTIPTTALKSPTTFKNRIREAMGMEQSADWGKFAVDNKLDELYNAETKKSPRLVEKAKNEIIKASRKYPAEYVFHGGPGNPLREGWTAKPVDAAVRNGTGDQSEGIGYYISGESGVGENYALWAKDQKLAMNEDNPFLNAFSFDGKTLSDIYNAGDANFFEEDNEDTHVVGNLTDLIERVTKRKYSHTAQFDANDFIVPGTLEKQELTNDSLNDIMRNEIKKDRILIEEVIRKHERGIEDKRNTKRTIEWDAELYGKEYLKAAEKLSNTKIETREVTDDAYLVKFDLPISKMNWLEWDRPVGDETVKKIWDAIKKYHTSNGKDISKYYTDYKSAFVVDRKNLAKTGRSFYYRVAELIDLNPYTKSGKSFYVLSYGNIHRGVGKEANASILLSKNGIDGMKYRGRDRVTEIRYTADYFNYVIYDPPKWITQDRIERVGLYEKPLEDAKKKIKKIIVLENVAIPSKQELYGYYGKEDAKEHQDALDAMFSFDEEKLATKYSVDRFRLELPPDKFMAAWGKALERAFNTRVVFYSASDKNGNRKDIQTSGRVLTYNSVAVNIADSKFKGNNERLMLHTTWHEIGHIMQQRNPALYNDMVRMLFKNKEVRDNYTAWRQLFLNREVKNDKGETVKFEKVFKGYRMGESIPEFVNDLIGRAGYEKKTLDLILKANDSVGDRVMRTLKYYLEKVLGQLNTWMDYLRGSNVTVTPRLKYTENLYRDIKDVRDTLQDHIVQFAKNEIKTQRRVQANINLSYDRSLKMFPKSLKDFFAKAKYPGKPWYHGTIHDIIGNWVTDRSQGSLDQRLGAQFGSSPELANLFAMGQYTKFNHARNRDNGYMLYDAMKDEWHLPGGRVYSVFTNVENPRDLRSDTLQDWQQIQYDAFNTLFKENRSKQLFIDLYHDTLGLDKNDLNREWNRMVKEDAWDSFFFEHDLPHFAELDPANTKAMDVADKFTKQYKNILRSKGYDSILYTHTDHEVDIDNTDALIVFDPDKIRSIYESDEAGRLETNGVKFNGYSSDIPLPASPNPTVDAEFEKNRGLGSLSNWEKLKEFGVKSFIDFKRQWIHLDPKLYGDIANTLYKRKYARDYGQKIAADMLFHVVKDLSPNRYTVFRRMVAMPDMLNYMRDYLQNNPRFSGEPFFGFNNMNEAQAYYDHWKRVADSDETISNALVKRSLMMDAWRQKMVDDKLLPENVLEERRKDYFRHQVLDWMAVKATGTDTSGGLSHGDSVRLQTANWQKMRKGTLHGYNTEYLEAEFEVLSQGIELRENKAALDHLRQYNKFDEFRAAWKEQLDDPGSEKDLKQFIKNAGYTLWQPRRGNFLRQTFTITDKALDRIAAEQREDPDMTWQDINDDVRGINRETVLGQPLPFWALPEPVAKQLDQLEPAPDTIQLAKLSAVTLSAWKQWVLFNPLRLTKYVFNNTSGDLDIALAYDPKILRFAKQASIDLYRWTKDPSLLGEDTRKQLDNALKQRVIDSGITLEEIGNPGDILKSDMFKFLDNTHKDLWEKYKDKPGDYMKFVKKWANMRENILRLAAYRYFQGRVATSDKVYGASIRSEIDNISDRDDRAAKLARELIGDYGNISKAGQWIRKNAIPFWSWLEINAPRYVRMLQNAGHEDELTGNVAARTGAVAIKKGAMLGAKAAMLFTAITMFNKIFFPDEDDELRKTGRGQLHLILGRREDGSIRTLRVQGALSDALNWLGFENISGDLKDVVTGRKDFFKQLKETAGAPIQKVVLAARPIERTAFEMALGKTMWPDMFNSRPIRDKYEHFFKAISMDIPYRYAVGKPVRGLEVDAENLLFYKADTGEAAYYKIVKKAREFLSDQGIELSISSPTPRSNALYYYKQAKKYGDDTAEEYWLEQFKKEGGKMQGIIQSSKKQHPTAFMPNKAKHEFMRSLDREDKDLYDMSVKWWKDTYMRR